MPQIEPAVERDLGGVRFQVDTEHEILVNKLCTLVQRSELRDLVDVEALLAHGGDFERALRDAPRKDGGFSPLTLTWQLKGFALRSVAQAEGWSESGIAEPERFRAALLARLAAVTRP